MNAYSQDLRQRVLHSIDAGQNQAEVAQTFSVSVATIKRYRHRNDEKWGMSCPKRYPDALQ